MDVYKTIAPVTFPSGTVLALATKQAATRAHVLQAGDEPGVYIASQPLEFKGGEIIGLALPPSKGETGLELIEQPKKADVSDDVEPKLQQDIKPAKSGKK